MNKVVIFFFSLGTSLIYANLLGSSSEVENQCFTTALSAGYVFKHDCTFKQLYGRGMINIITADGCYYPWECWGIGAKISYWRAKGRTAFLQRPSRVQEVPVTLYVRGIKDFECGLQVYASLGGGVIWMKEKSYLGCVKLHRGIAEAEVGLQYPIWHCLDITGAVRYLFPRQKQGCIKRDVGGCDLRAGLAFSF
jgi:hypothetical protein